MTNRIDFDIIEEDMDKEDTMTCLYCGKQYDMLDGGFGSFCSIECEDAYEQDPTKAKDNKKPGCGNCRFHSEVWSEKAKAYVQICLINKKLEDHEEEEYEPTDLDELPF